MTTLISRRRWLQAAGRAALVSPLPGVWAAAAPGVQPRLLVVFLRGAYDATNTLVPHASSFYHEVRPRIGLGRPGSGPGACEALSTDWGLHPALAPTLLPMWQDKQLAFIPFSGMAGISRSHFEVQDHIEIGRGPQTHDYSSGFLNRLAAVLPQAPAASFAETASPILSGAVSVPSISLPRASELGFLDARQAQLIQQMYRGQPLDTAVQEGFTTREAVARQLRQPASAPATAGAMMAASMAASATSAPAMPGREAELRREMQVASRGATAPGRLANLAPRLARLMQDMYRIGFIDLGGWDTHVSQGAATGPLADRLGELGRGLAALEQALGPTWADTTVVVMSEFGRTFRENGNRGTDHGHGSVMWVLGGAVRGGRVLGEQVASEARTLNENRDWPVLNDYRAVLGGLFARLYGLNAAALAQVFPGVKPLDVGLI